MIPLLDPQLLVLPMLSLGTDNREHDAIEGGLLICKL